MKQVSGASDGLGIGFGKARAGSQTNVAIRPAARAATAKWSSSFTTDELVSSANAYTGTRESTSAHRSATINRDGRRRSMGSIASRFQISRSMPRRPSAEDRWVLRSVLRIDDVRRIPDTDIHVGFDLALYKSV